MMFSNPKKFLKKNILLIGIVVLVIIIIAVYFLYVNFKEGFELGGGPFSLYRGGSAPEKIQLVPVETLERFYTSLNDTNDKKFVAPIIALYKWFVPNYDAIITASLQILAGAKAKADINQNRVDYPPSPVFTNNPVTDEVLNQEWLTKYQAASLRMQENLRAQDQKWGLIINPGLENVLISAINWLPTGKQLFDTIAKDSENISSFNEVGYGLFAPDPFDQNSLGHGSINTKAFSLIARFINTLYEADQLQIIFGPDLAKSNVNLLFNMPIDVQNPSTIGSTLKNMINKLPPTAHDFSRKFFGGITKPFYIIADYLMTSSILPDTIVNMVNTLKDALANASIDQATIAQLTGKLNASLANDATDQASIMQLTGKLNDALANDATDQATITNLQGRVDNLQTQQSNSVFKVDTNLMPTWATASTTMPTTATTATSPAQWTPNPTTTPKYVTKPMSKPKPVSKPVKNIWTW